MVIFCTALARLLQSSVAVQMREMTLVPPQLLLTVSLKVEQGTVHARVTADNPVVAEWLQANEQSLREGLKSNGLELERLVVSRDPDPSGRTPQREEQQAQREQRRRFNQRQSTFEIIA